MEDLTRLGKRTIFLCKAFFLSLLALVLIFGLIGNFFGNSVALTNDSITKSIGLLTLLILVFFFGMIAVLFGATSSIHVIIWVYKVTKNLRTKSKTFFSPWLSVIFLMVWYINIIALFGIMRNLTHVQEKLLKEVGIFSKPVPLKFLIAWLTSTLLCLVASHNNTSVFYVMFCFGCAALSILFFIKVLEIFVAQHNILYKFEQKQIFEKKVDEAIRNREIEKLAQEIKQAKYE